MPFALCSLLDACDPSVTDCDKVLNFPDSPEENAVDALQLRLLNNFKDYSQEALRNLPEWVRIRAATMEHNVPGAVLPIACRGLQRETLLATAFPCLPGRFFEWIHGMQPAKPEEWRKGWRLRVFRSVPRQAHVVYQPLQGAAAAAQPADLHILTPEDEFELAISRVEPDFELSGIPLRALLKQARPNIEKKCIARWPKHQHELERFDGALPRYRQSALQYLS